MFRSFEAAGGVAGGGFGAVRRGDAAGLAVRGRAGPDAAVRGRAGAAAAVPAAAVLAFAGTFGMRAGATVVVFTVEEGVAAVDFVGTTARSSAKAASANWRR